MCGGRGLVVEAGSRSDRSGESSEVVKETWKKC